MRTAFRLLIDKLFTGSAAGSVGVLCLVLGVVLGPMVWKGMGAVVFRETIEFRKMQLAIFGRGSEKEILRETAETDALRKPLLDAFEAFAEGIDVDKQVNRVREIYREYGESLRQRNTPAEEFTQLRNKAKTIRDQLTEALETVEGTEAIAKLDAMISREKEIPLGEPLLAEFFEIARRHKKTVEIIDPEHREQYSELLREVRDAMKTLFGPRPGHPKPPLAEHQFGATRWDLIQRGVHHLMYDEQWVQVAPDKPMHKILVPRKQQFAGTDLEGWFDRIETDLESLFRPRIRIYWQYFYDGSTPGHFFGGVGPEILGTLLLTSLAMIVAIPLGIVSAAYLVEYGGQNRMIRIIRTCINTLAGVPSIVFGLFGLAFFVMIFGRPCILAAALTLALLVLPVIIRASEEAIRSVPVTYKEASLSLGAGRFRTFMTVILPAAMPGILTGIILSVSRAAGETAPILFTGAVFLGPLPRSLLDSTRALPYGVHGIATGDKVGMTMPHQQYGMVMTLIILVLLLNVVAIGIRWRVSRRLRGY